MYFADYVQRLHGIVEPAMNKAEFTEKVLKLLITDEGKLRYSPSSYKGFYDGKTIGKGEGKRLVGDKIHNCARNMISHLDENNAKFSEYMKALQFNNAAREKLCDSFRDEISDISTDNYPVKLGQLLIKIIGDAAENDANTINMASDSSKTGTGIKTDRMTINHKEIERVIAILEDISVLYIKMDKIAYKQYERLMNNADFLLVPLREIKPDEEDQNDPELMKLREKFDTKNTLLLLYQESIPEVKRDIEEIVLESKCLRFRYIPYYISDNDPSISIGCEYLAAKGEHNNSGFLDRLQELMRKLTEMESVS